MIRVYKLARRHMDENEKMPKELKDIKLFSVCVGHGVGTVDFSEKTLEIPVKFKLGNLSKYFEVEIFREHAARLIPELCECELKKELENLREGYLVLRKDF